MARTDPATPAVAQPDILPELRLPPEYGARLSESLPADYRIPDPVFLAELRRLFPSRGQLPRIRAARRPKSPSRPGRTAGRSRVPKRRAVNRKRRP